MSANPSRSGESSGTSTGVHCDGLADNEAILDELADRLAGVGVGDFIDFIGIEPDLALAAADDGGREALLGAEIDPVEASCQRLRFLSDVEEGEYPSQAMLQRRDARSRLRLSPPSRQRLRQWVSYIVIDGRGVDG
jgi:hypothetical protein